MPSWDWDQGVRDVAVHFRAEQDAQHLLDRLGMTVVPVDPIKVARALGIEVWTSDLDRNVAGVLVRRKGNPAEIYVSPVDHINRQRFTIAHEVGHYVERAAKGQVGAPVSFVDYRDDISSQGSNPSERYANGFAAALLMPAALVRSQWSAAARPDADALARQFEVSAAAMRNRLSNLGLR